mmetsp:Transcript_25462/g.51372  ORF Transcript_25462/g.51372 Transcript_25462/m.51372 type:complete len:549 (+) Transcript_25462:21-1667(+)
MMNKTQQIHESKPLTSNQLTTLRSIPSNDRCAECPTFPADWASVTYGIVLCLDCAGIHRGLGVHLSFVRSLTMDDWSEKELATMMRGGNKRWMDYWKEHGGSSIGVGSEETANRNFLAQKIKTKYGSDVARAYREILAGDSSYGENIVAKSLSQSSQHKARVELTEEPIPTLQDVFKPTFLFLWNVGLANTKVRKMLLIWSSLGLGSSYAVHLKASRDMANNYTNANYFNLLVAGIVTVTIGLPCFVFIRMTKKVANGLINNRQDAFKSARNLLIDRISSGRASRLERCDVYYPKVVSEYHGADDKGDDESGNEKKAKCGMIFFPGALVDRTAYAPIASKISDFGVLVVIANHEKYSRCMLDFKNFKYKEEIMRMMYDALCSSSSGAWQVDEWALCGHSWGGSIAIVAMAKEMSSTMKKLVLWGVSSYPSEVSHSGGCDSLRDVKGMNVLVLCGSNDSYVKLNGPGTEKHEEFLAKLPPMKEEKMKFVCDDGSPGCTYQITIEGGNHAGCAHYGPQMYPLPDGQRTITLEEQQTQMAKLTADFLLCDV